MYELPPALPITTHTPEPLDPAVAEHMRVYRSMKGNPPPAGEREDAFLTGRLTLDDLTDKPEMPLYQN